MKARHGICGRALSGDAAGVEKVVLENWEEDFPRIIGSYKPEDIYSLDETGLYFRATTTKSLVLPKDTAHGIKHDKSRLTLMVCTSMLGEKEKLLLIWKSEKQRALKGADMSKLPVVYKAQRKAWMTGHIFCTWMKVFDNRIHNSGRKILSFMDNASVHKASDELSLKAVQLVYFPRNTTSCTQPLDAGVIQSLKLLYRKQVHEHLLTHMVNIDSNNKPNGDPYKIITIALAIVWASRAWNQLNARTISKCFAKCGFGVAPVVPELPMIINPEEIQIQTEENDECGIFPPVISPEELFEEALNNVTQGQNAHDLDCGIECDSEGDLSEVFPIPTSKAALEAIQVLQMYALGCGDEEVLGGNFKLQNYLLVVAARHTQEQRESKISEYFTNDPK